jgi:hypothetical protein
VAVVTKTLFSQTMGDDHDSPGISVFHAMFSVVDQLAGRPDSDERPCPVGPRNRGQFSASASERRHNATMTTSAREIMRVLIDDQRPNVY